MAKTTLSVIKADIGSIGGHIMPSRRLVERVTEVVAGGVGLIHDYYISHTGDDVAILTTHAHGVRNPRIHKLAWDAFVVGTAVAKEQGLYGAGQDLLKESFAGNVTGMGPAVAETSSRTRSGTRCGHTSLAKPSRCASRDSRARPCCQCRSWSTQG